MLYRLRSPPASPAVTDYGRKFVLAVATAQDLEVSRVSHCVPSLLQIERPCRPSSPDVGSEHATPPAPPHILVPISAPVPFPSTRHYRGTTFSVTCTHQSNRPHAHPFALDKPTIQFFWFCSSFCFCVLGSHIPVSIPVVVFAQIELSPTYPRHTHRRPIIRFFFKEVKNK